MSAHASINRAYSLVWSDEHQSYVAVPETARRRGKSNGTVTVVALAVAALFGCASSFALTPQALPTGGQVTAGQASISQSGNAMTIGQSTPKAAIDWQSFNIGGNASVDFVQPSASAIALNRVLGQNPTQILGALNANGQVFILNPNGVLFAPGAQVQAAGIVASTRHLDNADFMAGRLTFSGSGPGTVVNQGQLNARSGGYVALIGAQVVNQGVIEAHTVGTRNGSIVLMGDMKNGSAIVVGMLDASAPTGGDGGFIETSAAHVDLSSAPRVTTSAAQGQSGTWLIDPPDFTIAASGGDMTGAQLSSALGSTNVVIHSSSGASGTAGDVNVNDTVAWNANKLTLNAQNNININSTMTASGSASLALEYGQGAVAAGNTGRYRLADGVKVNLPGGNTFSTRLGSDCVATNFYVINALGAQASSTATDLQGVENDLAGNFALGADIDASATAAWNSGQGFRFIGTRSAGFSGNFEGLGHSIDKLAQNWNLGYVGLFSKLEAGGRVANVHLTNASIQATGYSVGALVGHNAGTIENSSVSGTIVGPNSIATDTGGLVGYNEGTITGSHVMANVTGNDAVGGLVGFNDASGVITASYSGGTVSGGARVGGLVGESNAAMDGLYSSSTVTGTGERVGGLIGYASGVVSNSHASGNVSSTSSIDNSVGGLVGDAYEIHDSYATGDVSGARAVGGLAGRAQGDITDSYATGQVSGRAMVGGLVGENYTFAVIDSHATGAVTATDSYVGGLIGYTGGHVENSHATGDVQGLYHVGGLIGGLSYRADIKTSSASGDVNGEANVGGLVGLFESCDICNITDSHATGAVTATSNYAGGLVGNADNYDGSITNSWATGNVAGVDYVGGLAGFATNLDNTYATGTVTGRNNVGGLVGAEKMGKTISNSYASGNVTGSTLNGPSTAVGGLVGYNDGTVANSYSVSKVTGSEVVGGLVGDNRGNIDNSVTGRAGVAGPVVTGDTLVGGLAGRHAGGSISNSTATGAVVASGDYVGGLAGTVDSGSVSGSSASGTVAGHNAVGGLIGVIGNAASVTSSHSSGAVSAVSNAGGVAGINNASLTGSGSDAVTSTSDVTVTSGQAGSYVGTNNGQIAGVTATHALTVAGAVQDVGGIVGVNNSLLINSRALNTVMAGNASNVGGAVGRNTANGAIVLSYADNAVSGQDSTGGLIGFNEGYTSIVYASGTVNGRNHVGGLVGRQAASGIVQEAYATASATGSDHVGGLIGSGAGTVLYTYAAGAVTGTGSNVGGLFGSNDGAGVELNYFDLESTGQAHSSGDHASTGEVATGKTTAEMKTASTFDGWDLSAEGSQGTSWRSYDGLARPLLTYWLTPLVVDAHGTSSTVTYDGQLHGATGGYSYSTTPDQSHLLGAAVYANARHVGTYNTLGGLYSDQQGYDISYENQGTLTITPAQLAMAANNFTKVYDGNNVATPDQGGLALTGFAPGEGGTFSPVQNGFYNSKNVAEANRVTFSLNGVTYTLNENTLASDYHLPSQEQVQGDARITPRSIEVTLQNPVVKTADGTRTAVLGGGNYAVGNLVEGESLGVTQTAGLYDTAQAGTGKLVTASLGAGDYSAGANTLLGNYELGSRDVSGPVGVILPAAAPRVPPQASASALASLPDPATGGEQNGSGAAAAVATGTVHAAGDGQLVEGGGGTPWLGSGITREDLLTRRAFSLGDGGIRLPAGVRGSDKDAPQ